MLQAGRAPSLADVKHVLRGSAANLGGGRVAAVCGRLEDAARAGGIAGPADLAQLGAELAAITALAATSA